MREKGCCVDVNYGRRVVSGYSATIEEIVGLAMASGVVLVPVLLILRASRRAKDNVKFSGLVAYIPLALGYLGLVLCFEYGLHISHVIEPGLDQIDWARISAFCGAAAGLVMSPFRGWSGIVNVGIALSIVVFLWAMFGQ
ncbi:MAG: hypothetical protein C5B50_08550 [Verrucomicrobia bacterium]|nr:MAG: hypothetical protein C5B50_08550 [Verrucomicrobiota bacterium]